MSRRDRLINMCLDAICQKENSTDNFKKKYENSTFFKQIDDVCDAIYDVSGIEDMEKYILTEIGDERIASCLASMIFYDKFDLEKENSEDKTEIQNCKSIIEIPAFTYTL